MKPLFLLAAALALPAQVIPVVRQAAMRGDFTVAESILTQARANGPWTPELLVAHSWLGRGAVANQRWDQAMDYAAATRKMALEQLKGRGIDAESNLPLALGASIEVNGQALAGAGRRSEGVAFLRGELARWKSSSMRARIQKNLHLLTLAGQPAPALELKEFLGKERLKSLATLRGRPVVLFLWAHWCSDCKAQGPVIEELRKEFANLAVVAPTKRYGYVAGGEDAPPATETAYMAEVQKQHYPWLSNVPMPVSEETFNLYGVSSTPTVIVLDAKGLVRLYNPGRISAEALRAALR